MAGNFSATIRGWASETKERLHAVRADAVQEMVAVMQTQGPSVKNPGGGAGGALPVDTGYLRSSLVAGQGALALPLTTKNPNPEGRFSYDPSPINLTIQGAAFETPLTIAYTANYAEKMEERYAFVRLATQRWPQLVAASAARAEAVVASRDR